MYEIWLVINILWEIALSVLPALLALMGAWGVVVVLAAARRGGAWWPALRRSLAFGALVAVLALFAIPLVLDSSISEVRYVADWLGLAGMAGGAGAGAALLAWPMLVLALARVPAAHKAANVLSQA